MGGGGGGGAGCNPDWAVSGILCVFLENCICDVMHVTDALSLDKQNTQKHPPKQRHITLGMSADVGFFLVLMWSLKSYNRE